MVRRLANLLTIEEVAKIFNIHKMTLRRWDKKGKLEAIRINSRGDRRYHPDDVSELINKKHEKN